MAIAHLIQRHLQHHRTRAVLTFAAIAVAVSLVTALTSAFASLRAAAYTVLGSMYGSTDMVIRPDQSRGVLIDGAIADELRNDPRVRRINARLISVSPLLDANDEPVRDRPASLIGLSIDAPADTSISALTSGRWFDNDDRDVAVVEEQVAQKLNVKVGDILGVPSPTGALHLKVIGVLGRPDMMRFGPPSVYLPIATLRDWLKEPNRFSEIDVDLKGDVDTDAFAAAFSKAHAEAMLRIETAATRQKNFDTNFEALTLLSYLGGTLSMIAAVFIVFSALTMGVSERTRELAMLRAIGALKSQVGRLVIGEGVVLAAIGAAAGVPLGLFWVSLLAWMYPKLFSAGAVFSSGGAIYGAGGTILAALIASFIPAWSASTADTLAALTSAGRPRRGRVTGIVIAAGALLLCVDPLIVFTPGIDRSVRMYVHLFIGLPSLMVGLVGVTPLVVMVVDRALSGLMAKIVAIEPTLLRQQLSGGLWRTTGTAAGLMVGLLALVVLQTHGRSMATGWALPTKFPDMLLAAPMGLDEDQVAKLQTLDEFSPPGVLPMAMVSPALAANIFGLGGFIKMPEGTILFGLDTNRAFGSGKPGDPPAMIELEYIEGDADSARKMLAMGHHVIVSEHYKRVKGLGVGDVITLDTPLNGKVDYIIAGVVRSVGIDMIVRIFEMNREFDRFTAAGAITTLEDVKRDFGTQRIFLMTANVDAKLNKGDVEKALREKLGAWGLLAADARRIKRGVDKALGQLLDLMSTIALAAIGVAAIGVTNTIVASVRSRRWQFGVLRSLGLTRGALLRLVLGEAMLIGIVAALVGTAGGLQLSVCANHLSAEVLGYVVPLVLPMRMLVSGVLITMIVAALAALYPATGAARADTLSMLKAGRAAE
ncbi:MAG: FtsX-like permease family protein [Planctomycetes bacterium]|nr:FtsX-like permease family protein [Planctomycetota bacterium]